MGADKIEYATTTEWIAANDHRTRHSHRRVDGDVIDPYQKFKVPVFRGDLQIGEELMEGPGDPKASAGNVINCRCTSAARIKYDERGEPIMRRGASPVLPQRFFENGGGEKPTGFKPAETWEDAVRFARENTIAYEMNGLSKLELDTFNTLNKVLYNAKKKYGIIYDKINVSKTQPKNYFIPAQNIMKVEDGLIVEHTLNINQGHIDWAKRKYGSFEAFLKKDNWFAADDMEGIIEHEFGHRITMGAFDSKERLFNWQKEVSKQRIDISGYGKTHGEEALAEIWSVYRTKGKSALKAEYIEFFNKYSVKTKIE
jgi:hypothetical protein